MVGTATRPTAPVTQTCNERLALRICGTSRAGQIVRLNSRKCSIGSGEHCTLRVRARSVKPLHCVIFRGGAKTVVRCWSPDTRLNGRSFSDAQLLPGDRLGVGPIEFEVVGPTEEGSQDSPRPTITGPVRPAGPQREEGSGTAGRKQLDQLTSRLVLANQQGRARVKRLIGQLRLARTDLLRLEQGATSPLADDREQESIAAQVRGRQEALEEEHQQWEAAREEAEQRLALRAEQLDEQMSQIETQKAALHRQRSEWEASRAEAEEQLVVRAEEVDRREAEFDDRLAGRRSESAAAEAVSIDSDLPDAGSPDDGLADAELEPTAPEATASDYFELAETDSPPSTGTDAESVQQYMARLLNRVGGAAADEVLEPADQTPELVSPVGSSDPVSEQPSWEEHADSDPDAEPACEACEAESAESAESNDEASASELAVDPEIAARESANASAEEAMDRTMQRARQSTATSRLLVAFLGTIGGIVSTWGWLTGTGSLLAFCGAITCFAIAGFSGVWYLLLMGNKPNLDLMPWEEARSCEDAPPAEEEPGVPSEE